MSLNIKEIILRGIENKNYFEIIPQPNYKILKEEQEKIDDVIGGILTLKRGLVQKGSDYYYYRELLPKKMDFIEEKLMIVVITNYQLTEEIAELYFSQIFSIFNKESISFHKISQNTIERMLDVYNKINCGELISCKSGKTRSKNKPNSLLDFEESGEEPSVILKDGENYSYDGKSSSEIDFKLSSSMVKGNQVNYSLLNNLKVYSVWRGLKCFYLIFCIIIILVLILIISFGLN